MLIAIELHFIDLRAILSIVNRTAVLAHHWIDLGINHVVPVLRRLHLSLCLVQSVTLQVVIGQRRSLLHILLVEGNIS